MKLAFPLAACLFAAGTALAAESPKLDMLAFFTGKTHADNVLKIAFKSPVKLIVDSVGGKGDRGDFVLVDSIREGDKPPRPRKWVMRQTGPSRYEGSLNDAGTTSPVDIQVDGNVAMVHYTMKGGLKVEQRLQLQADGKSMSNRTTVRKLGMKFATVEGTVRKLD